ncbi:hypothetical protein EW146_g2273 [Bondarzewia mesenterica]|uniref:Ribosomal RNA-processing protein 17 n=1 Tax=Bondarzewia mesenterica TaxID=1095465 RepID=A0A4S4M3G5_9AGAM|nr:hypothetical protein EW146_g2273 [Bondarzewia mesenterica]
MASNLAVLTKSHQVVAAKRRQKKAQVKEIAFDEDARREFLTGFHKRNLQKKEESRNRAIAKEKAERLEARREQRKMLAEQARENAQKVEEAYGNITGPTVGDNDDEWEGFGGEEAADYEDEEQLATVTVVEDFDPSTLLHGDPSPPQQSPHPHPHPQTGCPGARPIHSASAKGKEKATGQEIKRRVQKKVKYGTNAGRKADRMKQRARKVEKAERAGGKSARKKALELLHCSSGHVLERWFIITRVTEHHKAPRRQLAVITVAIALRELAITSPEQPT